MEDYKNIINQLLYNSGINLIEGKKINVQEVKEEVLLYLYLIILVINNDQYLQNFNNLNNCTSELNNIHFLNNDPNYVVGTHNKRIIKTIRNAFVHGSGKIVLQDKGLIISNDTRPNDVSINQNITMKIRKEDLISILDKVSNSIASNNDNINVSLEAINQINNGDTIQSKKLGYIILLTLMFSYNKESLFDKYMDFADSSLNLSGLKITDTRLLDDESQYNIKAYYEDNQMNFKKMEDELEYLKELAKMAENGYFIENTNSQKYKTWDPKLMSKDCENDIHIPNSLILLHLRNSVSHGLMTFDDNGILFNDYNQRNGNYFKIYLTYKQLNDLFVSNYLKEGVRTSVETHNEMNDTMYRTQIALSKFSISDYIMNYKQRFPEKNESEVLNYMIENNKISTYLYENPDSIGDFFECGLPDNRISLVEYISNYYGVDYLEMLKQSVNIWDRDVQIGIEKFAEFLKGNDQTFLLSKMIYFKNRYSYASIEEIKNTITDDEIKKLRNNTRLVTLYSFVNSDFFEELIFGNYINGTNEIERIMCATVYYDRYYLKNDGKSKKLDNIENVYNNSTEYKTTSSIVKNMSNSKLKYKTFFVKLKMRQKIYEILKTKVSKDRITNIIIIYDKLFLRSKYDAFMMNFLLSEIKEKKNENKNNSI